MQRIGPRAASTAVAIGVAALSGVALANDHGTKPAAAPAPAPKVYICHATGSASNPYVLIHVSSNALPAHTGHQGGRDIVLGSSPGACPHPAPAPQVSVAATVQSTPAQTESKPAETTAEPKHQESADNDTEAETENEHATPPQTKESDDAESDDSESDHVQSTSDDDHSESGD
jgi:type IV secretory pathway VirB10-like protein